MKSKIETITIAPLANDDTTITLNDAINKLAAIQAQERATKKEKKVLRDLVEATLRENSLSSHTTSEGHNASLFTRVTNPANKAFIESVLDEDQLLEAFPTKLVKGMKIT